MPIPGLRRLCGVCVLLAGLSTGAQQLPPAPGSAEGWLATAATRAGTGDTAGALAAYAEALALLRAAAGTYEQQAKTLFEIASLHVRRDEETRAGERLEEGRLVAAAHVADSVIHAQILRGLGYIADLREDYDTAEARYGEALAVLTRVAPDHLEVARVLVRLGVVHDRRTNPDEAARAFGRALDLGRQHGETAVEGAALNNLGMVSRNRGHLQEAEDYFRASLVLAEGAGPDTMDVALRLGNLGVVADLRGDLDAAEAYQERALAIREKHDPEGRSVFLSRTDLGIIAAKRGRHAVAEHRLRGALAIIERLAPDGISHADALANLALVVQERPDGAEEALALHRRALTLRARVVPGGPDEARSLSALGAIATREGRPDEADALHRRALAIRERLAPGSQDEATSLHALGGIARARGDLDAAMAWFLRSVDAFEGQSVRVGGSPEVQAGFRANWGALYSDPIEVLAGRGDAEGALVLFERARARAVVNLVTQRGSAREAGVPPALAADRRRVDAEFGRVQAALARQGASDAALADRLVAQLRELRVRQVELARAIREAAPTVAALQYPGPVDPARLRGSLDPGTVVLAYSVGATHTVLLTISRESIRAQTLPVGASQLEADVDRWRRLVSHGRIDPHDLSGVADAGATLYRHLVLPAAAEVARASRLLIVPDGPLQRLSFAALVEPPAGSEPNGRFLIERVPVSSIASLGVLEALKRRSTAGGSHDSDLLIFAAPDRPREPLPGAAREAQAIARVFGARARTFTGADASEAEARRWMPSARIIHVAAHGRVNDLLPLNSALLLSQADGAAGQDHGALQAWEVMEQVQLRADLVVLSACESSSGPADRAEGLLGLSGAFLFAGARAVVATLWAVADESAPDLMTAFYRGLHASQATDEALAVAQRQALASPETAHPFYWAPFVVTGVVR